METEILETNLKKICEIIHVNSLENKKVDLIAVTKYVDSDTIRQLYNLGLRKFGENRTEDMMTKQKELADINHEIEWHFIGQLQRRPVRKMINNISYLHSLDRMSLIKEVNKRAEDVVSSYLQVNISGEEQKGGFMPDEIESVIKQIGEYPNIRIEGLMTMAPYDASEKELRLYFSTLRKIQEEIKALQLTYAPCTQLSMGMSKDYPIAIQEGATVVRIGSAIYSETESTID